MIGGSGNDDVVSRPVGLAEAGSVDGADLRSDESFPRDEIYGLTSQMRYKRFLGIARGSSFELQTQLVIARELGFGDSEQIGLADDLRNETGKMIFGAIRTLKEA